MGSKERTLQKGSVMFGGKTEMQKLVANFWRIMSEFPWLWAIQEEWYPGFTEIIVSQNLSILDQDCSFGREAQGRLWVKLGDRGERVIEIDLEEEHYNGHKVAYTVFDGSVCGYLIEHLAYMEKELGGRKKVYVYRAPKGTSLHDIVYGLYEKDRKKYCQ